MFIRNISTCPQVHTALQPIRQTDTLTAVITSNLKRNAFSLCLSLCYFHSIPFLYSCHSFVYLYSFCLTLPFLILLSFLVYFVPFQWLHSFFLSLSYTSFVRFSLISYFNSLYLYYFLFPFNISFHCRVSRCFAPVTLTLVF